MSLKSFSGLALLILTLFIACSEGSVENNGPTEEINTVEDSTTTPTIGVDTTPPPPPMSEYERTFLDSGLVDIAEFIPGILIELKYSTTDNFLNFDVYGNLEKCYLRIEAAEKLKKAQSLLQTEHPDLTLLVYDGARPHRVQYKMWEVLDVPNKLNYLSPPDKGSVHNYGCAVDLTVANLEGVALDMGTKFDFFGPLAQPKLESKMLASGELSQEQYENRLILRKAMEGAGFFNIRTEWWHFNAFGSKTVKHRFTIIN